MQRELTGIEKGGIVYKEAPRVCLIDYQLIFDWLAVMEIKRDDMTIFIGSLQQELARR